MYVCRYRCTCGVQVQGVTSSGRMRLAGARKSLPGAANLHRPVPSLPTPPTSWAQAPPSDPLHQTIEQHLHQAATYVGKQATPDLVLRALQLHDMLSIRTGILLLGPPACGKTATWSLLQLALSRMDEAAGGRPVEVQEIFPRAVHPSHLYGSYNTTHQHWADGVLTSALRAACSRNAAGGRSWLILDGPVDRCVWALFCGAAGAGIDRTCVREAVNDRPGCPHVRKHSSRLLMLPPDHDAAHLTFSLARSQCVDRGVEPGA